MWQLTQSQLHSKITQLIITLMFFRLDAKLSHLCTEEANNHSMHDLNLHYKNVSIVVSNSTIA